MSAAKRRRQTRPTLSQTAKEAHTVGARLRLVRERAGQSRAAAEKVTGIQAASLIRYEADTRDMPAPAVAAVCRAYRVSADWLVLGDGRGPARVARKAG